MLVCVSSEARRSTGHIGLTPFFYFVIKSENIVISSFSWNLYFGTYRDYGTYTLLPTAHSASTLRPAAPHLFLHAKVPRPVRLAHNGYNSDGTRIGATRFVILL